METTRYNHSRRHRHHSQPASPDQLIRSRSGNSATSVSPGGLVNHRSKSTTESRRLHNQNNNNRIKSVQSARTSPNNNNTMITAYGFIRTPPPPHNNNNNNNNKSTPIVNPNGSNKSTGSLGGFAARLMARRGSSAWALSPGRSSSSSSSSSSSPAPEKGKYYSGGGVGGVLRYFRGQKKVSPLEEEDFHCYKVLHNRLIQWRFVNARAQLAISSSNNLTKTKILSVWIRMYAMRNSILEKKLEIERLKCEIKLYEILFPQIMFLNEWAKLDKRNQESVAMLITTLSAFSKSLPLVHGAKGDIISVYEAMSEAMVAMDGIEEIINKFFIQVERILYMVTELLITYKQHEENLEELEKSVTFVAALVEEETTLRTHCIQAAIGYVTISKNN